MSTGFSTRLLVKVIYSLHTVGLLQVGDRIVEVNNETVDSMSPAELQAMLVSFT